MAVKKSELYASLWKSCDELRGGMDASQYKDYVLVLLFMKYVSDRYAGDPDGQIFVPEGSRFGDLVALKGDKEIGDKLNKAIAALAEENDLTGVITLVDFNDPDKLGKGREMVDRLSNLIGIFNAPGLDFSGNRAEGDDLLGDAYEFLMRHFATESGKSKGQFYTPAEVSTVMARLLGIGADTPASRSAHDPTCGSGSLLLKVAAEAPHGLTLYGQEMDNATSALAKMNMILHDCTTGAIEKGNTLSSPQFRDAAGQLKAFDYVVANPPFSSKAWSNGLQPQDDEFGRFVYGVPPEKNGDYAFLLHILKVLKSTGRAAVILPHGVLFRGGAEGLIRQRLLKQGFIQTLIGLPANLFYGTGIPACILVLDKSQAATRDSVFVVDASRGFRKDGNKNRLRAQDIHRLVDVVTRAVEAERYARRVPLAEIEANDWNLNIPRYIDGSEPEDLQDIEAHLRGGIPRRDIDALQRYWAVFPGVRAALFEDLAGRPGHVRLKVPAAEIRAAIFGHAEFTAFNATVSGRFAAWREESTAGLRALAAGDAARALVRALGESILARFEGAPLIDAYDVYQHLMDYWDEVMQDDVSQIVQDGWRAQPNTDLIPMPLVVARYFAADAAWVAELETVRDGFTRLLEELEEEHGGEDGLLGAEARTDKGKLTALSVKARLKAVKGDPGAADERVPLEAWLALNDQEADAGRRIKDARKALETKAARQYAALSDEEIRALVIDDKWMTRLAADVQSELDRVSQGLTGRVRELGERYAVPLPELLTDLDRLSTRVDAHLKNILSAQQ
jgi:type I restriction enzyme M protein